MLDLKLFSLVSGLFLVGCGVEVHSDNHAVNRPNLIRYSVILINRTANQEVASGCINLDDEYDHGHVEIQQDLLREKFVFAWDNKMNDIRFNFEQNDYSLSDSIYTHKFFDLNEVSMSFYTKKKTEYQFMAYSDSYCHD